MGKENVLYPPWIGTRSTTRFIPGELSHIEGGEEKARKGGSGRLSVLCFDVFCVLILELHLILAPRFLADCPQMMVKRITIVLGTPPSIYTHYPSSQFPCVLSVNAQRHHAVSSGSVHSQSTGLPRIILY